jgi:hypothetical protein
MADEVSDQHFGNPKIVTVVQITEEVASNAVTRGEATF